MKKWPSSKSMPVYSRRDISINDILMEIHGAIEYLENVDLELFNNYFDVTHSSCMLRISDIKQELLLCWCKSHVISFTTSHAPKHLHFRNIPQAFFLTFSKYFEILLTHLIRRWYFYLLPNHKYVQQRCLNNNDADNCSNEKVFAFLEGGGSKTITKFWIHAKWSEWFS